MLKIKSIAFLAVFLALAVIVSFAAAKSEQNQVVNQQQNQGQEQEQNQLTGQQNQEQNQEGQVNAQEQRSVVANFVQSLLKVATGTENGIGEQVRTIAREQNESASATIQAMEQVQTRNKIKTFLVGTDYKNLGVLRSEVVQTRNRIEQLDRVIENATDTNASNTAEIQAQIQNLEQEQLRIENFVDEQESKFSLFGWLLKLFNR